MSLLKQRGAEAEEKTIDPPPVAGRYQGKSHGECQIEHPGGKSCARHRSLVSDIGDVHDLIAKKKNKTAEAQGQEAGYHLHRPAHPGREEVHQKSCAHVPSFLHQGAGDDEGGPDDQVYDEFFHPLGRITEKIPQQGVSKGEKSCDQAQQPGKRPLGPVPSLYKFPHNDFTPDLLHHSGRTIRGPAPQGSSLGLLAYFLLYQID